MPPPRPRGVGYTTGVASARPSPNTPMSERQQMALLIQMTAPPASDLSRTHIKKNEHKKSEEVEEASSNEKQDVPDVIRDKNATSEELNSDNNKKEVNSENVDTSTSTTNLPKRNFSDVDDDDFDECDEVKKKKRKDSDSGKESKSLQNLRMPARVDKNIRQVAATAKSSPTSNKSTLLSEKDTTTSESVKPNTSKACDADTGSGGSVAASGTGGNSGNGTSIGSNGNGSNSAISSGQVGASTTGAPNVVIGGNGGEDEFSKMTDNMYNGGLKVPPLKIVIPQQNCAIDTDGSVSRTGKINTSRSAALPYVVSSSNDSNDKDTSAGTPTTGTTTTSTTSTSSTAQCNSPHESPLKVNTVNCSGVIDEKNVKLLTEEKNLHRVLRSSHRSGITSLERSSNNSSPQMQSSSPSPASSNANDVIENKSSSYSNVTTSPLQQNQTYDTDNIVNLPSPSTSSTSSSKEVNSSNSVELHPRKRKIRSKTDDNHLKLSASSSTTTTTTATTSSSSTSSASNLTCLENPAVPSDAHPHDLPFTNCFQMYLNIRRQIEKKWKNLYSVKPRPPQGFSEYLLNKRTYLLSGKNEKLTIQPTIQIPNSISTKMREVYLIQEKERKELQQRHVVEKEKLCLNVEQEIIRVHSKAARNISCQSVPFSACTFLKDEEVYNVITPEQEEKDRSARYRFNGRLLLGWLQDVDDKWEKIKESMVLRHHNEAESLHAVQLMDWEIALKKYELCDFKSQIVVETDHVPIVYVSDDFDLLPA